MTVEEKNRDIALMKKENELQEQFNTIRQYAHGNQSPAEFPRYIERDYCTYTIVLTDLYWSFLLPVWSKLRGELMPHVMSNEKIRDTVIIIQGAIATDVDIETAHSLIHSAIEWLNKNKV